jgi:hypothetical protein
MALNLIQHSHLSLYICFAINTQAGTKIDDDTLKEVVAANSESDKYSK